MKMKDIKPGEWYETKQGEGQVVSVGGTHPPSVRVNILKPFPRGTINLAPRDILLHVPPPEGITPVERH